MYHDMSDLGSLILILIQITPKERNLNIADNDSVSNFTAQHAMKNVFVSDCTGLVDFAVKILSLPCPQRKTLLGWTGVVRMNARLAHPTFNHS